MARLGFVMLFAAIILIGAGAVEVNEAVPEEGANGTAVVLLSIAHIQQAAIFPDDNEMLRRIAYVETRDGTDPDTYSEGNFGGIWAVSEAAFSNTKNTNNVLLTLKHEQIMQEFEITWERVEFSELRKPLYSALAARLVLFIAPRAIPSATDVTAQAQFWKENYNSGGTVEDFISATNELQGAVLQNSASDFYVGFARNNEGPQSEQQLFITTREPDPVPFTVRTLLGFHFTGVATSNTTTVVPLGSSYQVFSSDERNKGIHVSAGNKQIVVYGLNYASSTSDAFLALPCGQFTVDEYEYYGITYVDNSDRPSQLLFVGCEDDTTINIASTTITLNRMETYLLETSDDSTGTRIIANKPVSFFSGSLCAFIPADRGACDHLTEQFPPTATWGTRFLSASFSGRTSGDIYRILTSQPSTTVTVNCTTYSQPETYSLATAGAWQEFRTSADSFCVIESSHPLMVVEFGLAHDIDNVGDPFMMMIPPIEQYSNTYVLNVLSEFSTNYITMFVSPEHFEPEKVFVDDISQGRANWTTIYCTDGTVCGHAAHASLEAGEHRLYHSDSLATVGVAAYGFNTYNSYGYPGGLQLTPIQLATVSFSQQTYAVREHEQTLTVSVSRSGETESFVVVLVANHPFEGSATAGQDYSTVTKVLEFESGVTEKDVTIDIIDDRFIEVDETFVLYLSSGAGAFLSPFAQAEITIINDDGTIQLSPNYGNQLGGAPIMVSGTDVSIGEDDNITCIFDDHEVKGVYVNKERALCVSPELSRTGTVLFQLQIGDKPGDILFSGETNFISLPYEKSFEVLVESEEPVFESGSSVTVYWSPQGIFPFADAESYTVDITIREFNADTSEWNTLTTLASDLPNNGEAKLTILELPTVENLEDSISPVVVEVGVSSTSTTDENGDPFSNVLSKVSQFGLRVLKQSPMRVLRKMIGPAVQQNPGGFPLIQRDQRSACEEWALTQPDNIGAQINNRLPPCPCTAERARAPNSGFKEERLSSVVKVIGKVRDFVDTTLIDDAFRNYFHPGAASCFRQRVTNPTLTGGSGQQCCYDRRGDIIVGPPGGGTVDIVSPDVSTFDHFVKDVVPFWLCCKAGFTSNCGRYYQHRPSDNCSRSEPPPVPARARGDPHLVTLDGHQYTFNGRGEFTLIETPDNSFTLQGRMVDIANVNGTAALATVFSAIVAREGESDTVQFEILANDSLAAFVNGEEVDFSIVEQEFKNLTVTDLGNNTVSATFSSGAYLEVQQENGIISSMVISLPESYMNAQTKGLLGTFNGDITDDLQPKLSGTPLSLNATLQEIHEHFGLTWIIDTPGGSMFSYQPEESWATYYDPYFEPVFQPVFGNADLELEATRLCGDDIFCLFDVAATGNIELGLSTHRTSQQIDALEQLSLPIVCDPPCENGACVANDTCACSEGFSGATCDEKIVMECEENPCQNGGNCTRHVNDFTCTCPVGFSGFLCEVVSQSGNVTVGYEMTVYTTTETRGIVELCAVVTSHTAGAPEAFNISATSRDGLAVAGFDYIEVVGEELTFNRGDTRICHIINILQDSLFEFFPNEYFFVDLSPVSAVQPITIVPPTAQVIIDDSSEPECSCLFLVNDTLTGDPLMTVPLQTELNALAGDELTSLCYEVHGATDKFFSLISDGCTAVNAHYAKAAINSTNIDLNVVDAVGVKAVDNSNICREIRVGLDGCQATVDGVSINGTYRLDGVSVREYNDRVRIAVPNCDDNSLVMWVYCMDGVARDRVSQDDFSYRMIRFVVTRGLNLNEQSHGIIGQFWNVPIDVEEYTGTVRGSVRADDYVVTVRYPGSEPRSFFGLLYHMTWEYERRPCIYAGNSQAGPSDEVDTPNDSVIEGKYTDYEVDSMFATDFVYGHFEADRC